MNLLSRSWMKALLGAKICRIGFLWRSKRAENLTLAIYSYCSTEPGFVFSYSNKSNAAIFSGLPTIMLVYRMWDISQIIYPVIRWVTISMVNFILWVYAIYEHPRQSMSPIITAINAYFDIPRGNKASFGTNTRAATAAPNSPCELTAYRIIFQKGSNLFDKLSFSLHGSAPAVWIRVVASLIAVPRFAHITLLEQ